jgi:aspartate 1-decarboxylase
VVNGGAALKIPRGHLVSIMAFGMSDRVVKPQRVVLDRENRVIREG